MAEFIALRLDSLEQRAKEKEEIYKSTETRVLWIIPL